MRIAKIKNSYMYKGDNPAGAHHYAVYYDKKSKKYRAVQLTHLYVKDKKRFSQVKKNLISIEKFKEFDVPSGVCNSYYDHDIDGNDIVLKNNRNIFYLSKRYLNKNQSNRIKKFAHKKRK